MVDKFPKSFKKTGLLLLALMVAGLALMTLAPPTTYAQPKAYIKLSARAGATGSLITITGLTTTGMTGCGILTLTDNDNNDLIFGETCWDKNGMFSWTGPLPRAGSWLNADDRVVNKSVPLGELSIGFYRPIVINPTSILGQPVSFRVTDNQNGPVAGFTADGILPLPMTKMNSLWTLSDFLVAQGQVKRSWLWGPQLGGFYEPYEDAPNGWRYVRYHEKSRMEVTQPFATFKANPYYVTNGLLVSEMVNGRIQAGDNAFQKVAGCVLPVAGDLSENNRSPVFGQFYLFLNFNENKEGTILNRTIGLQARNGIEPEPYYNRYNTYATDYVKETNHYIANVFRDFLDSSGSLYGEDDKVYTGKLFNPRFYATGYPIVEPYWTKTTVGGVEKDVLVQLFERRVLTYTPSNPPGFQVEMGNVGLQYYQWRYNAS